LLTLVAFLVVGIPALACSCGRSAPSACPDAKEAGASFVGTVTDIENPADDRRGADQSGTSRYHFRVDEAISGIGDKEVDVYSGRGGGDCSYHFQLGQTYFVTPYGNEGKLFATVCSDTQPVSYATALLSELRAKRDGQPVASLYGLLQRTQQPYAWTITDGYDRPLPGVTVELHGTANTLSTQTDKDGIYRFCGVPADTYHFEAKLPPNLELAQTILSDPPPPITLPDHACYQEDLDALPTGRIRGRLIGPGGSPLKNGDVALFREDRYKESEMGWWEFQDEEKGHFEFSHVSPGKYIIVFNNSNRLDPVIPYHRTFYPGSPDLKSAIVITLEEGQEILDADIHVAAGQPTRLLKVRVHWTENPVPEDVMVTSEGSDGNQGFGKKLSPGLFEFTLLRGVRYTVYAEQDCGLRWDGSIGRPVGNRESERVEVEGSDERTSEVSVSLKDGTCHPYHTDRQ
jgi:hypothetical protein